MGGAIGAAGCPYRSPPISPVTDFPPGFQPLPPRFLPAPALRRASPCLENSGRVKRPRLEWCVTSIRKTWWCGRESLGGLRLRCSVGAAAEA